jgi:hypothetical protein
VHDDCAAASKGFPEAPQLIKEALKAQILGQLIERLVVGCELQ